MMRWDANGVLVFADVVGSGVARRSATTSGNPPHDTRSGKFGGGGGPKRKTNAPANVDPAAYARYRDAVREAARKFPGKLTPENIEGFIRQRAGDPGAVNIQAFAEAIGQQQLDDIVDALDTNHGGFKVTAPSGYLSKVLGGLSDDNVSEIVQRLKARGIKDPHLKFGRALPGERKEAIRQIDAQKEEKAKVTASVDWGISDSEMLVFVERPPSKDLLLMADAIAKIPAPIVNVAPPEVHVEPAQITVEIPPVQLTRKTVERDEQGLITRVTEEPLA